MSIPFNACASAAICEGEDDIDPFEEIEEQLEEIDDCWYAYM